MIQAIHKLVTFEDFAAWRPEGGRYELHDGVIVEMAQPVRDHEDIGRCANLARLTNTETDTIAFLNS